MRGEIRWCQGYSEPGSGSDLAGLRTRADDMGDYYLVNGSKIWTSYADEADWIFCLVRTNFDVPKHEGISFLLFDMASPGVSTSPITLISGSSPFCQTFFDNVKVPKQNLVGTAESRLDDRETPAAARTPDGRRHRRQLGARRDGPQDGRHREGICRRRRWAHRGRRHPQQDHRTPNERPRLSTDVGAFRSKKRKPGRANGDLSSMFKYYGTEQNKRKYEVLLETMGTQAVGWDGAAFSDRELNTTRQWLRSKANSIEGGTSEVQLNVIAKRVLGLPD